MEGRTRQIRAVRVPASSPTDLTRKTVNLIGQGIKAGSHYPPIRLLAAQVAARAPGQKNYLAQLRALFHEFLKRWKYIKDPTGLETVATSGRAIHNLVLGAADPRGIGHGDCDDATVGLASLARSVGIDPRVVVMAAPLKPGQRGPARPSHVYPEFFIPGLGWIPADPVAFLNGTPLGVEPRAAWRRRYDLDGRAIGAPLGGEEIDPMRATNGLNGLDGWDGFGLEQAGLAGLDDEMPADWAKYVDGFGAFASQLGTLNGLGLLCEVEPDTADGLVRTPMLEVRPHDFEYLQRTGAPYVGMVALGDDGSTYQFQYAPGVGGFFKSIFKGAKKLFKGAKKFARKLIKKLPGGKYLIRLHDKIHKIAMKLVRPLAKWVGPLARRLSPIAAMIPGYGPAIAGALHLTGKIANLVKKHGIAGGKGKLKFKNKEQHKAFREDLKKEAQEAREKKLHLKVKFPGHIKKGTPAHAAKLRAAGVKTAQQPAA